MSQTILKDIAPLSHPALTNLPFRNTNPCCPLEEEADEIWSGMMALERGGRGRPKRYEPYQAAFPIAFQIASANGEVCSGTFPLPPPSLTRRD